MVALPVKGGTLPFGSFNIISLCRGIFHILPVTLWADRGPTGGKPVPEGTERPTPGMTSALEGWRLVTQKRTLALVLNKGNPNRVLHETFLVRKVNIYTIWRKGKKYFYLMPGCRRSSRTGSWTPRTGLPSWYRPSGPGWPLCSSVCRAEPVQKILRWLDFFYIVE